MNKSVINIRLPVHNVEHRIRDAACVMTLGSNALRERQPFRVPDGLHEKSDESLDEERHTLDQRQSCCG